MGLSLSKEEGVIVHRLFTLPIVRLLAVGFVFLIVNIAAGSVTSRTPKVPRSRVPS
jgi:hypothetical protein